MFEDDKNKIEDIKRKLYDPNDKASVHRREGVLHEISHNVSGEWQDSQFQQENNMKNKIKKPRISMFKIFFILSVVFFIGALGFAYYKFSNNEVSVSADKIDIEVIGSAFTKGGEDLPLQIEVANNNNANLESVNLIIEYPKGANDIATDIVRLPKDSIGTIKPGERVVRNATVRLFGEEKSIRNIKISLEYRAEGSGAILTKDKNYPVTISLAPLSLNIEAPTETTSDQPVSIKITASLNTSLPQENPILQVTYPNNFVFEEAIPAPILSNSVWDLSAITTTNPVVVEIKGHITGQEGEEQVFHAYAGTTDGMDQSVVKIVYSSVLQKIIITKPFLDARILVNGQDKKEYVVSGGEVVDAEISWANNLPTRITDAQIIVSLSGNVFDRSTVDPGGGFYDSINNQIIWDKNAASNLSEINPGEKGTVSFSFKPTSLIGLYTIKDPQVLMKVSIKGRQPLLGSTFSDINNFSEKVVKILSNFQISSSVAYLSGSFPPKAETETRYIITWTLSNSANNIVGAEAHSSLPIYVKWGGLSAGENKNVIYNDVTREVTWKIGSVSPNTGISSTNEASFIVTLNPSLAQVGSIPQLMTEVYLSGTDSFTNVLISSKRDSITTLLSNSSNSQIENGRVVK